MGWCRMVWCGVGWCIPLQGAGSTCYLHLARQYHRKGMHAVDTRHVHHTWSRCLLVPWPMYVPCMLLYVYIYIFNETCNNVIGHGNCSPTVGQAMSQPGTSPPHPISITSHQYYVDQISKKALLRLCNFNARQGIN